MKYKIIKFDYPKWWNDIGGVFSLMLPNDDGVLGDCKFYINDDSIKKCDYWFICEDHSRYLFQIVQCPKENCILITNEAESMWNYDKNYLKQFGRIMTCRADIEGNNVIQQQHIFAWHVKKNHSFLTNTQIPNKIEDISAVISNAFSLEGHRKRYKLMNRLKGHFKDKLHWFGKGETPIDDKWDGLAPYKYSIAIENSSHYRYFTEKITDCYLSYTMPIYWGCPNILDYFPKESLIMIEDIDDYKKTIYQIENAIENNYFEKGFEKIIEARNLILSKYQVFYFLKNWIEKDTKFTNQYPKKNLIKEKAFFSRKLNHKQKLYYFYKRLKHLIL
jgi:hypothetical protein